MSTELPNLRALLNAKKIKSSELAKALKVNKSMVTRWSQTKVPAERVPAVAAATGIPRDMIRPDIYGVVASDPKPKARVKRPMREAAE